MPTYSFSKCLENAYRVNWKISDVLASEPFDRSRTWLPTSLSGASRLTSLNDEERRKLTHVEMSAYAHLFAYVEEFIAPKVSTLAVEHAVDDREAFDALTNFAAEEVKHMNLFRKLRGEVDTALGFELERLGGQAATAHFVLGKSTGAVLLLTACIEWFTQRHFLEAFREDDSLDPRTKRVFKAHWQEESQHAQMDHMETLRAFAEMTTAERDIAVDELIELVAALDGLLQQQVQHDLANFARYTRQDRSPAELDELRDALLEAKRWTFLFSGVTHPRFEELLHEVTSPAQRDRIGAALQDLASPSLATP